MEQTLVSGGAVREQPDGKHVFRRRLDSRAAIAEVERYDVESLRPSDTIHGCLQAVAAVTPDKPAMIMLEPPDVLTPVRTLSYRDVVLSIEQAARVFLAGSGGDRPPVVGILMPMLPEGLISLWGAQTVGIAVPVNPFLGLRALAAILNETGATILVTLRRVLEEKSPTAIEDLRRAVPSLTQVLLVDDADPEMDLGTAMARYDRGGLPADHVADATRTSMIMPTGGTTGAPKLVRMSQRGQLIVAWNVSSLMGPREDGVVAHGMPNFHVGGTISLGLRTLVFGQTLLTLSREGFRTKEVIARFWQIAETFKVTSLLATPATALALLHQAAGPAGASTIEDFHVGGSPLPMDLVQDFHQRFGIWLRENWGMTEMHGTTTGHPNDFTQPRVGSAGVPLPHYRVRVVELDAEGHWRRDCAVGERGLLLMSGPTITAGYLNESLDADFFISGVPGGAVWANTGDLGSVDEDGYVWVFGRAKDLIIRGGHNIDPREIEDALLQHPDVHIAAAVGQPDRLKGELPVAYVELKPGASVESAELMEFCRAHVAERAAAPVSISIVGRMPLTPVGKVSKPALRKDAMENRIRTGVADVLGERAFRVRIEDSGPKLRAVVSVPPEVASDATLSRELAACLAGYEFASEITSDDSW